MEKYTDKDILAMKKITPHIAGRYLGRGTDTIRYGMQSGLFPFGVAVKMPSGRWVYDIRPQALVDYNRGAKAG